MNLENISGYLDMMEYIYNISVKTNDLELKQICVENLKKFINKLYISKIINEKSYKELLKKYNIDDDLLDNTDKLDLYKAELKNIFNNSNKESIKVWLLNFVSYAKGENIDYNEVIKYVNDLFNIFDKDKKYFNYVSEFLKHEYGNKKETDELNTKLDDKKEILDIVNTKYKFYSTKDKKDLRYKSLLGIPNVLDDSLYSSLLEKIESDIDNDLISNIRYSIIKKELLKSGNGSFDNNYKRNRLTSMLLNNKIDNVHYKEYLSTQDDTSILVKDIYKGMRII